MYITEIEIKELFCYFFEGIEMIDNKKDLKETIKIIENKCKKKFAATVYECISDQIRYYKNENKDINKCIEDLKKDIILKDKFVEDMRRRNNNSNIITKSIDSKDYKCKIVGHKW